MASTNYTLCEAIQANQAALHTKLTKPQVSHIALILNGPNYITTEDYEEITQDNNTATKAARILVKTVTKSTDEKCHEAFLSALKSSDLAAVNLAELIQETLVCEGAREEIIGIVVSLSKDKVELIAGILRDKKIITDSQLKEIQDAPASTNTATALVNFTIKKRLSEVDAFVKALRSEKVAEDQLADKIQGTISGGNLQAQPKKSEQRGDSNEKKDGQISEEKKKLEELLSGVVMKDRPNVKWDDVAGLQNAKGSLKETVILPITQPQLFVGDRKAWTGILLFGPPGTGKSYLAKAAATEAKSTFFSLSASNILSKWVGDSEKQIKYLFDQARLAKPSIIFIDEMDSIGRTRTDTESNPVQRIMNEFLVQMDGVGKENAGVLVLGATNIPWVLDKAILRRFQKRIYIPLPEDQARLDMFRFYTRNTLNDLTDDDFKYLASCTNGYTGSDIRVVVNDALMQPVREAEKATHFVKRATQKGIGSYMLAPCSPDETGAVKMKLDEVPKKQLLVRDIKMADFEQAQISNKPTVKVEDLKKFEQFLDSSEQEG